MDNLTKKYLQVRSNVINLSSHPKPQEPEDSLTAEDPYPLHSPQVQ